MNPGQAKLLAAEERFARQYADVQTELARVEAEVAARDEALQRARAIVSGWRSEAVDDHEPSKWIGSLDGLVAALALPQDCPDPRCKNGWIQAVWSGVPTIRCEHPDCPFGPLPVQGGK